MSSNANNTDINALIALLRQQAGQGSSGDRPGNPALASNLWPGQREAVRNSGSSALAMLTGTGSSLSGSAADAQAPPQLPNIGVAQGNDSIHQQQQLVGLLTSAQLLSSVNPTLAKGTVLVLNRSYLIVYYLYSHQTKNHHSCNGSSPVPRITDVCNISSCWKWFGTTTECSVCRWYPFPIIQFNDFAVFSCIYCDESKWTNGS